MLRGSWDGTDNTLSCKPMILCQSELIGLGLKMAGGGEHAWLKVCASAFNRVVTIEQLCFRSQGVSRVRPSLSIRITLRNFYWSKRLKGSRLRNINVQSSALLSGFGKRSVDYHSPSIPHIPRGDQMAPLIAQQMLACLRHGVGRFPD